MTFYVAAHPTAMGFPKTHLFSDCPSLKKAVVKTFNFPPTTICATCVKRQNTGKDR